MNNAPFDDGFGDERRRPNRSRRSRWLLFLPLLILVLFLWPGWAGFYSEYLWFQELGYQRVFTRTLLTKFGLGAVVTVLSALLLWLNIKLAFKLSAAYTAMVRYITINNERVPLSDIGRYIERWIFLIALLIGLFFGLSVWESWEVILQYNYQAAFGDIDPLFGRDISFYFFTLPFLEFVAQLIFLFVIVCLISAGVVYVLRGGIVFGNSMPMLRSGPRKHLCGIVTGKQSQTEIKGNKRK